MNRITELLTEVATCLCAQIATDGSPPLCFCGVLPGEATVADYASECGEQCGMAWVRLTSAYPATGTGVPSEEPGNCTASTGLEIEVGILRCFLGMGEDGGPPAPAEMLAAAEQQHADILTMMRAIYCCAAIPTKDAVVGTYAPTGPLGGLYGGVLPVSLVL